jgi:hypothetical protein
MKECSMPANIKPDIVAIVADRVTDTGAVDHSFIFNVPAFVWANRPWGPLLRQYDHPYLRWELSLFDSGGIVFKDGIADDASGRKLPEIIANVPACIVLIDLGTLPLLREACKVEHLELVSYRVDGELPTSRRS